MSGVVSGGNYVSSVGLASMIFTPLLPVNGGYPRVATFEGDALGYPNPFNPEIESITIAYKMGEDAEVKVYIFDISGRVVRTLRASSSARGADGYSRVSWDGTSGFNGTVANGVYLVYIVSEGKTVAKTKIMVVR